MKRSPTASKKAPNAWDPANSTPGKGQQVRKRTDKTVLALTVGVHLLPSPEGLPDAVASDFLAELGPWSFVDWMKSGLPSFVLLFPLTWWLLCRLVKTPVTALDVEPARA